MANNVDGPEITFKASGTLAGKQFYIMTLDTNGRVKLADDPDDPVEAMLGVLQNEPTAIDEPAVVRVDGIAKVIGGATIEEGIWVTCDSAGKLAAAVANDNVLGITIEAAALNKISQVLLRQGAGYVAPV